MAVSKGSFWRPPQSWRRLHRIHWLIAGVLALVWLLLRSGTKPSRLAYPCQQAAASTAALVFGGTVVGGVVAIRRRLSVRWLTPVGLLLGGVGLIAACDMAIAADTAQFGLTEVRLGLAPAVISAYVIRCIGEGNARRYFLSGERFDTRQAQLIGLIQQSVATEQLDQVVEDRIGQLLKGGPLAMAQCKQLSFTIAGHDADSQKTLDEYTAKLIARLRVSTEGQEGLAAFLEKRKPDWIRD